MKLPSFRRLFSGDFQSQFKQLVDTLAVSLNNGIEVLYEALNNGLTLEDNISCTIKNITLTVDANGKPTGNSTIKLNTTDKVDGCVVLNAINQTTSGVYPAGGIFISWSQTSQTLNINNITGLQANQSYLLTVVAFQQ